MSSPFVSAYRAILRATHNHGMGTLARLNVRVFPSGQHVTLESGLPFWIPPDPHFFGFLLGRHEHHLAGVMRERIRPGDCCIDVGANIGYFASLMSGWCGDAGRVLAYEPETQNFQLLRVNATLAADCGRTIVPIHAAVSDLAGELALVRSSLSTMHRVETLDSGHQSESVPSIVLDDDIPARDIGAIRLMKVDVEGHEVHVLRGCERLVAARRIECMLIEVFPGESAREVDEIVTSWGAKPKVWLDRAWRDLPLRDLPYCTDILVDF